MHDLDAMLKVVNEESNASTMRAAQHWGTSP